MMWMSHEALAHGEEMRQEIGQHVVVEVTGFAAEWCARVAERLQRDVSEEERFVPVVVWTQDAGAFTMPGRYIYVSRALLDRPALPEEAVAFTFAHEMAHHLLGHMPDMDSVRGRLATMATVLSWHAMGVVVSAERERQADAHALRLCHAAGYDVSRCLALFDSMMQRFEEYGAIEQAYGSREIDARIIDAQEDDGVLLQVRKALSVIDRRLKTVTTGYPTLRERVDALESLIRTEFSTSSPACTTRRPKAAVKSAGLESAREPVPRTADVVATIPRDAPLDVARQIYRLLSRQAYARGDMEAVERLTCELERIECERLPVDATSP
jgi:Zn-dependent protease with chaperone function